MREVFEFEAPDVQPFSFEDEDEIRGRRRGPSPRMRSRYGPIPRRRIPVRPWRRPGVKWPPRFPLGASTQSSQGSGQSGSMTPPEDSQCLQCSEQLVRWIQSSLNGILGLNLPVDGVMTAQTRSAIRNFQQREGLPVNGIAGSDTHQALIAAMRAPASVVGTDTAGPPAGNGNGQVQPPDEAMEFLPEFDSREFDLESDFRNWQTEMNRPYLSPGSPQEQFFGAVSWMPTVQQAAAASRIIDLTGQADKSERHGMRDPKKVDTLVLHQMACCFSVANPLTRFLKKFAPHFAIMPDGQILQLHPILAMTWASNNFNANSVAVEFAGNFPNTSGKWWYDQEWIKKLNQTQAQAYIRANTNQVTPQQVEAGRYLVQHLINTMGLKKIVTHRQSSNTRDNDPGPDVWYQVGQWAVDNLRLSDGGPGYKIGKGAAIPDIWRKWGTVRPTPIGVPPTPGPAPSSASGSVVLREGSRGQPVINLQLGLNRWLISQGKAPLQTDGDFGGRTKAAVLAFQRAVGLTPDGVVGSQTEMALIAAGAGPVPGGSGGASSSIGKVTLPNLPELVSKLNRYRGEIPLSFLLGWIAVESGGRIGVTTSLDERGYFQIHPDESKTLRLDHNRLSTDPDYSLQSGISLVKHYANRAKQLGLTYGTDLYWHVVKLLHWLPGGVKLIMEMMSQAGYKPQTWAEFREYVVKRQDEIKLRMKQSFGKVWDPLRGLQNVDKLFEKGKSIVGSN